MATFQVGEYTCKAFGKAAEKLLTMEGQTVEMCGTRQRHRLNKDIEEFVTDGRYVGKAFSSVPNETIRPEVLATSSADRITLKKEKQIEFYMDLLKDYSPEQLRLQMRFGNREDDKEAARRLLERALKVEAPTRSLCSPSVEPPLPQESIGC